MDVFSLRDRVIGDYADYVSSFIKIADLAIKRYVQAEMSNGLLWPQPLLQLNPSFQPGKTIGQLVAEKALHPQCDGIFRLKDEDGQGPLLNLHLHQTEAIYAANSGDSYVVTTGTGSGKSLAYIIPIVNYVLRVGSGAGIRAIVVYPMNALANSQFFELEKSYSCLPRCGWRGWWSRSTSQSTRRRRQGTGFQHRRSCGEPAMAVNRCAM